MFGRKKEVTNTGNVKKKTIVKSSGATKMKKVEYGPNGKTTTKEKMSAPGSLLQSKSRVVRVNEKGYKPYKQSVERQMSLGNIPLMRTYKNKK